MKYYDEDTGRLFDTIEEYNKYKENFNEEKRRKENLKKEREAREQEVKQKVVELDRLIKKYVQDYGGISYPLRGYLWSYLV